MRHALLALTLVLGGCTATQVNDQLRHSGTLRTEPHPTVAGAYRMTWFVRQEGAWSEQIVNQNTAAGRAELTAAAVGPGCRNPRIIQESEMAGAPDTLGRPRRYIVNRVECG